MAWCLGFGIAHWLRAVCLQCRCVSDERETKPQCSACPSPKLGPSETEWTQCTLKAASLCGLVVIDLGQSSNRTRQPLFFSLPYRNSDL